MTATRTVLIRDDESIVAARQIARNVAKEMGFGSVDQARIATAVSELARNVVRYATDGRGELALRAVNQNGREGLEIVVSDEGPGIADIEKVLREGFTSGRGLGMGLPGTKRMMDEMSIESAPGAGTTVTVRKWRR